MLGGAPVLNSMIFGTMMLSGLAHGTQTSPNGSVPTGTQAVPIATQPPVAGQQPSGCPPGKQCPPAGAAAPVQQNLSQQAGALVGDATEVAKGALADVSGMAGNALATAQNFLGNLLGSKQETVHAVSKQPMPQKQFVQHVTTTTTNSQTAGEPTAQGDPLSRMLQKPVAPVPTTQADADLVQAQQQQVMQGINGGNTVTRTVTRHHHSNAWPSAHQTLAQQTVNGQKVNPMNNLFQRIQQMKGNVAKHANNFGNGAMQTFHQTVTSSTKPVQPVYQPSQTVVETKTVTKTENVHSPAPVSPGTETVAEVTVQTQAKQAE